MDIDALERALQVRQVEMDSMIEVAIERRLIADDMIGFFMGSTAITPSRVKKTKVQTKAIPFMEAEFDPESLTDANPFENDVTEKWPETFVDVVMGRVYMADVTVCTVDEFYDVDMDVAVTFPPLFYLEGEIQPVDPVRHKIDRTRFKSSMRYFPDWRLYKEDRNPYEYSLDTSCQNAADVWRELVDLRNSTVDEICQSIPGGLDIEFVADVLRDLALFGMCGRYTNTEGDTIFVCNPADYT